MDGGVPPHDAYLGTRMTQPCTNGTIGYVPCTSEIW